MNSEIIKSGLKTIEIEALSIKGLYTSINSDFESSVKLILNSKGRLIVTGMGKSGIIGSKIAATLASTGTPSFFLHPAEAYHGDLGMVKPEDIILAISNSGETDEVLKLIPFFNSNQNKIIAITKNINSSLSKNAANTLQINVENEACDYNIVPTSSTTATLVMGDALAIAIMQQRGFNEEHFAQLHPGGSLGKKLVTKVRDVMKMADLPFIDLDTEFNDIIKVMTLGRLGMAVVHSDQKLVGIITDGDIRRLLNKKPENLYHIKAHEIMSYHPISVDSELKLIQAEELMMEKKISSLLVVQNQTCIGVIQMYDL